MYSIQNKMKIKIKKKVLIHRFQGQKHFVYNYNDGYEDKRNDYQPKKPLMAKQFIPVSTLGNVQRTVWIVYIIN